MGSNVFLRWRPRVSVYALSVYFRGLATLIMSGVPVHRALDFMGEATDRELAAATRALVTEIERGESLDIAMLHYPRVFPPLAVHLVSVGLRSGRLDLALDRLSKLLEYQLRLGQKLVAVLVYPLTLLVVTLVISLLIVTVVFPAEMAAYTDLGTDFPWFSKLMLQSVSVLFNPYTAFLAMLLVGGTIVSWNLYAPEARERISCRLHSWLLDLPVLGPILHKAETARVLFTVVTLLEAGATFTSTRIASTATGNLEMRRRFEKFLEGVQGGLKVPEALELYRVFPAIALQMVHVAEAQGNLTYLLKKAAILYEDEVEHSLVTLSQLLEPVAIGIMGVTILCVVVATSLPMLHMVQSL
ncbi:MAG: type II secretion system F family protein [Armatimonadetes bacterium]|nr:type II secretion system F family protein [Armatimonadota bacterium]